MTKEVNVFQEIANATAPVDNKTKSQVVSLAEKLIKKGRVNVQLSGKQLNFDEAVVVEYKETGNYGVAIRYFSKDEVLDVSNLTLIFDKFNNLLRYQELVVEASSQNEVSYKYFIENEEVNSGTLDTTDSELSTQSWLSCMNTCLANQGLSNWAIGLFAALCAAACGTVILCAACIEGPLLVYSTQIMYCINHC